MTDATEYYVDPNLGSDTGSGTKALPWGRTNTEVIQYALTTGITSQGAGGDRINVLVGAGARDIVPTGGYDITTNYGTPDGNQPLYIQGYTVDEGDGGKGGIDVDAKVMFLQATSIDYIFLFDLDITDLNGTPGTPTNSIQLDRNSHITNCSIHGLTPTSSVIQMSINSGVQFNHIYDCTGSGIGAGCRWIYRNRFITGPTNNFGTAAIENLTIDAVALENIIHVTGASHGIDSPSTSSRCITNSIFSDGGTGHGINEDASGSGTGCLFLSNLIEGFSGVSGVGMLVNVSPSILLKDGNGVFNCETAYSNANTGLNYGVDETLPFSPFRDAPNDDFSPVIVGAVREGFRPNKIGEF